ncbi:MAG: glucose 1-dehydrogenase [Planctomycetota bacterium]|nr:glucose 1-dehydrogenase [Planctomycetota bacterium]
MKAIAAFPNQREIKLIDVPEPRLETPAQVKLRMLEVGVCGTDKEICRFDYGTPPAGSEFLVLGHESVGEVAEAGNDAGGLKPGDLVIPTVRRPCPHGHCLACRQGRQDFCYTGDFTERGIKERHGYMTEFVVDESKYMVPVPKELREIAVLVEPLTIAEKALIQVWNVQQRLPWTCEFVPGKGQGHCHKAVVLGAGPVGLLGAMALSANGFETYVYSRSAGESRAPLVESFGAHYVPAETHSVEDLARVVGNIDLVYEAVGASQLAFDMLRTLGPNAVFVFTGVPGRKGPVSVDTDLLMRNLVLKNQILFGTVNAGREAFEAAIKDLTTFQKRWPAAVNSLITGYFPMDGYADLLKGRAGGIKNVLQIG